MKLSHAAAGLTALGLLFGANVADAALLAGNSIDAFTSFQYVVGGGGNGPAGTVIAPGSVTIPTTDIEAAYTDTSVTLLYDAPHSSEIFRTTDFLTGRVFAFNGLIIEGTTVQLGITSVMLDPSSTVTPTDLFLSNGEIALNLAGDTLATGDKIVLDFNAPTAPAVPEPASWALMFAGFGGVGLMSRRRRALDCLA